VDQALEAMVAPAKDQEKGHLEGLEEAQAEVVQVVTQAVQAQVGSVGLQVASADLQAPEGTEVALDSAVEVQGDP